MKKSILSLISSFLILLSFSGCASSGEKNASLLGVYASVAVISFLLLLGYFLIIKKRELWLALLFSCVFIVNIGYLCLAISDNLETALMANRISYLGSVFLPMSMLMIIARASNLKYNKLLPILLSAVGVFVFLIAASPGILHLYYKEVSLQVVNGVTVLNKVYGPLHLTYYIYLFTYFASMVCIIIYTSVKKRVSSSAHAVIVAFAVLINIGVWLLEQFVDFGFELLSISYIISGIFLLGLNFFIQDEAKNKPIEYKEKFENVCTSPDVPETSALISTPSEDESEKYELFRKGVKSLTATEKMIFDLYLAGKGTKDVLSEMNIKENTLKYHNKNIYSKLEVSSRKQLLEIAVNIGMKSQ